MKLKERELRSDMMKALRTRFSRGKVRFKNQPEHMTSLACSSLENLAASYATERGLKHTDKPDMADIWDCLKERRSGSGPFQVTSDFASLVGDAMNRQIVHSYESLKGYQSWAGFVTHFQARDFKTIERPQLGSLTAPQEVIAGADFPLHAIQYSASASDNVITYQCKTYGLATSLTRQAFISDDLGAFDMIFSMHQGMIDKLSDLVIAELTASANYTSGRGNTSSSHTNLDAAIAKMQEQGRLVKPPGDTAHKGLGLELGFLVVPPQLENAAHLAKQKLYGDAEHSLKPGAPFKVCVEPRLSSSPRVVYGVSKACSVMPFIDYATVGAPTLQTMPKLFKTENNDVLYWCFKADFAAKMLNPVLAQKAEIAAAGG